LGFSLPDHWVWDFWTVDDGTTFHLFFLHAPKSLGDPDRRHRNARIGHATSQDLNSWTFHGEALGPGPAGAFDETATWTGSIVRDADGLWRLFYTGSRFLSPDSNANIETIGMAVSKDLHNWEKRTGPVCRADPQWYETLGSSSWPEEAWRDPWVFADPHGDGWHMLVTARANSGDDADRGIIGHAVSTDLETWSEQPPLSRGGEGFGHIEVLQTVVVNGANYVLFSCDAKRLAGKRSGQMGGVWSAPCDSPLGPFHIGQASLLSPERYYAGRLVQDRAGDWMFLGFNNATPRRGFAGGLCDPIAVMVDPRSGSLVLSETVEL
jgi:beta-fructofuranosidase